MFPLRCPVRNCSHPLTQTGNRLVCAAGHSFDQAKEGYWNLTQPQDKKSKTPGDHQDAVVARHRWLNRGHAAGLVQALEPWLPNPDSHPKILDLGCGDGFFGPALFPKQANHFCGIDLSKPAIKLAAKRWSEATWVLANADRELPVLDESVDCVMSLFGRRPVAEIRRVLKPDSICIVAVPAEDDLIELREQVQKEGKRRNRINAIIEQMEDQGLVCTDQKKWSHQVVLCAEEISDAFAMTYRAVRKSQQQVAQEIKSTQVTLAADLLRFRVGRNGS